MEKFNLRSEVLWIPSWPLTDVLLWTSPFLSLSFHLYTFRYSDIIFKCLGRLKPVSIRYSYCKVMLNYWQRKNNFECQYNGQEMNIKWFTPQPCISWRLFLHTPYPLTPECNHPSSSFHRECSILFTIWIAVVSLSSQRLSNTARESLPCDTVSVSLSQICHLTFHVSCT